jgi:PAS domain S-box-containing protein
MLADDGKVVAIAPRRTAPVAAPLRSRVRPGLRALLAIAFAVLAAATGGGAALLAQRDSATVLRDDAGEALAEASRSVADTLDRGMFERWRDISVVASLDPMRDPAATPETRRGLLRRLHKTYPDYAILAFISPDGRVAATSNGMVEGADVSRRPFFLAGRERPFVGDVHDALLMADLFNRSPDDPPRFVDLTAPVRGPDGTLVGVVGAHLFWEWAEEIERGVLGPLRRRVPGAEVFILADDGTVLLGPNGWRGRSLAGQPGFAEARSGRPWHGAAHWAGTDARPGGAEFVAGWAATKGYRSYPGLGWTVVARQDATAAVAPADRMRDRIMGWGAVAAVLAAALGWALAGRLAGPIEAPARHSDRLRREAGDAAAGQAASGQAASGQANDNLPGGGAPPAEAAAAQDAALTREEASLSGALAGLASERDAAASALGRTGGDLARREAELRGLLDACPVGVILADTGGRVREANDAFLRMVGLTRDDLEQGRVRWDELTPPELLPRDEAAIAEAVTTGRCPPYEKEFVRADGSRVPVLVAFSLVDRATGQAASYLVDLTERRRAEEALRQSEARLRGIFDSTFQFIGLLAPDGTLLEANRTALEFGGFPAAAVMGRPFWDAPWWTGSPDPEAPARLRAAVAEAAGGAFVRYEVEVGGAAGSTAVIDFSLRPVRDEAGRVVLLVPEGRDVTERVRAEAALREAEARQHLAFDAARIHSWDWNVATGRVAWPDGLEAELGFPPGGSGGTVDTFRGLVHPEDLLGVEAALARALAGETDDYRAEFRMRRPDGSVRWTETRGTVLRDAAGRPLRVVGVDHDVTDRRAAEEALRAQEAFLRSVLDASTDCVMVVEADGRVAFMNENGLRAMEIDSLGAVEGADWASFWPEESRPRVRAALAAALAGRPDRFEAFCPTAKGSPRWCDVAVAPVRDDAGAVRRIAAVSRDVSATRAALAEQRDGAEMLRLSQEAALTASYVQDLRTGEFRWAAGSRAALGFAPGPDAMPYAEWRDVRHPEDRERIDAERAAALARGDPEARYDFRIVRPDTAAVRNVEVRARREFDAAGRPLRAFGVVIDVTERQRGEDLQRDQKEALELAVAGAPLADVLGRIAAAAGGCMDGGGRAAVFVLDEAGRTLRRAAAAGLSDAYLRAADGLAVGPDALPCGVAARSGQRVVAADVEREPLWAPLLPLARAEGIRGCWSTPIRAPGGTVHGTLAVYPGEAREPTPRELDRIDILAGTAAVLIERHRADEQRERAEAALAEGEERLRLAHEAAGIGTWDWDIQTGAVQWSPQTFALHGLEPASRPPNFATWRGAVHPDDRAEAEAAVRDALAAGRRYEAEYRVLLPDGGERWIASLGRAFTAGNGKPARMLGVNVDITARKAWEAELGEANAVLEARVAERSRALEHAAGELQAEMRRREEAQGALLQSQKLEALGQLTGGVAHDFNNILAAIQGSYRLLDRHVAANPKAAELVGHGMRAAERGAKLIAQLMAFARREELKPVLTDPAEVLRGAEDMVCHTAGKRVRCDFAVDDGVRPVIVDQVRLETVLLNLAANARDAMPAGGTISVSVRNARPDELPPEVQPGRDHVLVAVADTGAGMDAETLRRATEPFFTTKPAGKGTGLGLASAHGFAIQSSGALRIRSAVGEGTTVELFLPRADLLPYDPDIAAAADDAAVLDQARHGGASILLADDDDAVRPVAAGMLRRLGYRVVQAPTAEAAEMLGLAEPGGIDMLVTDVVMGGATGPMLAARLRADRPDLPVLYLTGHAYSAAIDDAPVLRKPFTEAMLARAVLAGLGRLGGAGLSGTTDRLRERLRRPALRDAYLRWIALRGGPGGRLPAPDAFAGDDLPEETADHAFLAEAPAGGADGFRFVRVGRALEERLGRSLAGEVVGGAEEAVGEALGGTLGAAYRRCANGRAPLYDYARFALGDGKPILLERLVLPLSSDGAAVTHLAGVALFTELDESEEGRG